MYGGLADGIAEADHEADPERAANRVAEKPGPDRHAGRTAAEIDEDAGDRYVVLHDQNEAAPAGEELLATDNPFLVARVALCVEREDAVAIAASAPPVEDVEETEPDDAREKRERQRCVTRPGKGTARDHRRTRAADQLQEDGVGADQGADEQQRHVRADDREHDATDAEDVTDRGVPFLRRLLERLLDRRLDLLVRHQPMVPGWRFERLSAQIRPEVAWCRHVRSSSAAVASRALPGRSAS